MSGPVTRAAFERLIAEDVAWLRQQPATLERDHILQILERAVEMYYPPPPTGPDGRPLWIAEYERKEPR